MTKRILSLLLAVLIVFSLFVPGFASEEPAENMEVMESITEAEPEMTPDAEDTPVPGSIFLLERLSAELIELLPDRHIQICQREELFIPESSNNPSEFVNFL